MGSWITHVVWKIVIKMVYMCLCAPFSLTAIISTGLTWSKQKLKNSALAEVHLVVVVVVVVVVVIVFFAVIFMFVCVC